MLWPSIDSIRPFLSSPLIFQFINDWMSRWAGINNKNQIHYKCSWIFVMRLWQLTKGIVSEPFEACVQFDAVCDKLVSNEKGRKWNVLCWIVWEKDKTKMISPWKNAFDLLKRITKRTEMMFYFDFDHFFSLSIQTLSTSFRYRRKIVWFNSIMHRKRTKAKWNR